MLRRCATFDLISVGFLHSLWLYGQRKTTLEYLYFFKFMYALLTVLKNQNNDTFQSIAQYTLHIMFPLQKYSEES